MIIHKLIAHHLSHRDDPEFYFLQARDAVGWIEKYRGPFAHATTVLDLGAGHGIFGGVLLERGCEVTFADETNQLSPQWAAAPFRKLNLDKESLGSLGSYQLVICSNVLEHLAKPSEFLSSVRTLLDPGGHLYLSWTNWLSPWGGHEFSPFHYLGAKRGHRLYDKLIQRPRLHTPFVNLYPTHIGRTLRHIRQQSGLELVRAAPRYYPELAFLLRLPVVREFLTWNCALLLKRPS